MSVNVVAMIINYLRSGFQLENHPIEEPAVEAEDESGEQQQKIEPTAQKLALPEENQLNATAENPVASSAQPTTVITTQRHRMITEAGHIR